MATSRAGSFEEWLASVEDQEAEKQEMERERKEAAEAAKARKLAASEGRFDTWVHTKMHQTKAIKVRLDWLLLKYDAACRKTCNSQPIGPLFTGFLASLPLIASQDLHL